MRRARNSTKECFKTVEELKHNPRYSKIWHYSKGIALELFAGIKYQIGTESFWLGWDCITAAIWCSGISSTELRARLRKLNDIAMMTSSRSEKETRSHQTSSGIRRGYNRR